MKLCANTRRKFSLPKLNYNRKIMATATWLRTKHFKDMKILPDDSRTYVVFKHCPDTQLDPKQLFGYPSIPCTLFKIDIKCNMDTDIQIRPRTLPRQWLKPLPSFNFYQHFYYHLVIHDNNNKWIILLEFGWNS